MFSLNNDLYICLCYVPPENSSRQTLIETHTFDRLLDFITQLYVNVSDDFNFVLCGDLNAHTSDLPDFVANDTFNENLLPEDYISDSHITRCSQDKGRVNNNGLILLDLCKQTGMRIVNGRFDKDLMGRYTHVGARGSSVVDYVLTTQAMLNNIQSFSVGEPNIMSDHCIVNFSLSFCKPNEIHSEANTSTAPCSNNEQNPTDSKYVWKSEKKNTFCEKLSNDYILSKLTQFNNSTLNAKSTDDIDKCVTELSNIIEEVASPDFKYCSKNLSSKSDIHESSKDWFDDQCFETRRQFYNLLNVYRDNKTDENRSNMVAARSVYKNYIKKCKYEYDKLQTVKLKDANIKNAKLYWKMLKSCSNIPDSNIPANNFKRYFESVSNPSDPFLSPTKTYCIS